MPDPQKPKPDKVGLACDATGDCGDGFCWLAPSGKGICTRECFSDSDCGARGQCTEYSTGFFCARRCIDEKGCPAGFACFADYGCYPADGLDCDASQPKCVTSGGKPGGCVRFALGAGITGYCFESCRVGEGSCSTGLDGAPRSCIVYDSVWAGGAGLSGPICVAQHPVANQPGEPCLDSDGNYVPWACADGSECDLFSIGADGLCHTLCEKPSVAAQAQTPTQTANQTPTQTANDTCVCTDVFGLFDSATPVGLCK